ncbi:MAG: T9SS type A sorting domain-containing protein [Bacteroidota bacterium]|nr:T9SS type A sorting domain-containing protein [Bacteroidota bacterium]
MKKLLFISLLLMSVAGKSQDTLSIGQYDYTVYNDTLSSGTEDSVSFWVINSGPSTFNDSLFLITEVQDSAGFLFTAVDTNWLVPTIFGGDSIRMTLYSTYYTTPTPNQYHYDINVIVIWPFGINAITGDSLFYTVFVTLPLGISELDLSGLISCYPNPVAGQFGILNSSNFSIERVRIYNNAGTFISEHRKTECIPVDLLSKGMYLIEIELDNGQRHSVRIIKQ